MNAQLSPRQMVAETLRNGRRWSQSFKGFKPVITAMVREGELHRIAPPNGKARNMVELTGRGWSRYFGENLIVNRLDQFAELMAQGFEPADAGRELNLTKQEADAAEREIRAQMGAQAS